MDKTEKLYRKKLYEAYNHLYQKHYEIDYSVCYYCGNEKEAIDHVPPLNVVDYVTTEKLRKMGIDFMLIPSCKNCNSILWSKYLANVGERLSHLYVKLIDKYEKQSSLWHPEEIEEMSTMFQEMIKSKQRNAEILLRRIRHIEKRLSENYDDPLSLGECYGNS